MDTVLRTELNLPDGLADPKVYVLDPCCGTGSYLVEVLDRIHRTLKERGEDALTAGDLKEVAQRRVFGFEILPAPFVISHLQLGLFLQRAGAPLSDDKHERAGVYLTNALTGWEPPNEAKKHFLFPELEEEREAAEHVKRDKPILVILGNPPYNAFAGVSPEEEQGLVEPYKAGLVKEWGIKKFNLDDLYVRFFRLAERRIAEKTGRGVVCYISNHSWLSDPSFVVLRQHLLASFERFWVENMHGNRKISEYAPDGRTSETIFAIPGFSVGIQQGVAISLWVKSGKKQPEKKVLFRDDLTAARAIDRRADLLESIKEKDFDGHYRPAVPIKENRFSFRPQAVTAEYSAWPAIDSLADFGPSLGILENRAEALISIDDSPLEERMREYYNASVEWGTLKDHKAGLTRNFARFDAKKTRLKVLAKESFHSDALRRLLIRPMDQRWCYYSSVRPLWNEPRPDYWQQCWSGNASLVSRRKGVASPEGVPFFFTSSIGFQHALHTDAYYFPLQLRTAATQAQSTTQGVLPQSQFATTANLSAAARSYLAEIGIADPDNDAHTAGLIWMHILAVGYSPAYLTENIDGVRRDWPRIPLPNSKASLLASAELGNQIASLLDTESGVKGVTSGDIRPDLKLLAVPTRAAEGSATEDDWALTGGWGHRGKGGVVMPGKGKLIERDYTAKERAAIEQGAKALGHTEESAFAHLGERACDVYLNDGSCWSGVPVKVWEYTIGGYQVIKKWLSYREKTILGRALSKEEVREVREMARRIAAILLLEPALNANYQGVKENAFPWSKTEQ